MSAPPPRALGENRYISSTMSQSLSTPESVSSHPPSTYSKEHVVATLQLARVEEAARIYKALKITFHPSNVTPLTHCEINDLLTRSSPEHSRPENSRPENSRPENLSEEAVVTETCCVQGCSHPTNLLHHTTHFPICQWCAAKYSAMTYERDSDPTNAVLRCP